MYKNTYIELSPKKDGTDYSNYGIYLAMMNKLSSEHRIELNENLINGYWESIKHYHIDTIGHAFWRLSRDFEFFPKKKNFIQYCSICLRDYPTVPLIPAPPEPILSEEEELYKKIKISYLLKGYVKDEPNSEEGFKKYINTANYKFSKISKIVPHGRALELIEKYSKPEHWSK